MPDLKDRFRTLDRISAPDQWSDIRRREPAEVSLGPSWSRVAVAALAFAVAAAGIGAAGWAFIAQHSRLVDRPPSIGRKANGKIAFQTGYGPRARIWVMNPDGSGAHRIGSGSDPAWSPDGSRIAFRTNFVGERSDLAVMGPDGSNERTIVSGVRFTQGSGVGGAPSWAPDGRQLVFAARGGLFVVGAGGGRPHLLTHIPDCDEYDPAWSPDDSRIAFSVACTEELSDSQAGILTVRTDGTGRHRIVGPNATATDPVPHPGLHASGLPAFPPNNPSWSPDGRRVAFDANGGEGYYGPTYLVDSDGSNLIELGSGAMPAWSPDGSAIVYSYTDPRDSRTNIYAIGIDGNDRERLTSTKAADFTAPSWQPLPVPTSTPVPPTTIPSGTLKPTAQASVFGDIAYVSSSGSEERIWVMHADGSGKHAIVSGIDPGWSPDGTHIVFRTNFVNGTSPKDPARFDIAVVNADGSGQRTLGTGAKVVGVIRFGGAPAWSPDGSTVVFAAEEGLFAVLAGGGKPRLLAHSPDCLEYDPAWSPDGKQIVFGVGCDEEHTKAEAGIAVINADGTGWRRIVGYGGFNAFPPTHPAWSPDGRYITFDTETEAGGTVYIAKADGSHVFAFVDGIEPIWSPDGSRIAYVVDGIYVIGVDGTGRKRLASGASPAWQSTLGSP